MMLRRKLFKPLFDRHGVPSLPELRHSSIQHSSLQSPHETNSADCRFCRRKLTLPDSDGRTLLRRFLQRRGVYQSISRVPEYLALPIGGKLREKLSELHITEDRDQIVGLGPPLAERSIGDSISGISVKEARKILRISQMEMLKAKLRSIPETSISQSEFVRLCLEICENDVQGNEFAKILDDSGSVIVLGNVVFLRPDQVARSMGTIISQSIATPNDPRMKELCAMEKQKAIIDEKAQAQVQLELYCGLGLLMAQNIGLMRLTFWDLSWDVMEPICFFLTTAHVAVGYVFFLRTSTEPSLEGFFRCRFKAKQAKLMDIYNFDIARYHELRKVCCYPFPK